MYLAGCRRTGDHLHSPSLPRLIKQQCHDCSSKKQHYQLHSKSQLLRHVACRLSTTDACNSTVTPWILTFQVLFIYNRTTTETSESYLSHMPAYFIVTASALHTLTENTIQKQHLIFNLISEFLTEQDWITVSLRDASAGLLDGFLRTLTLLDLVVNPSWSYSKLSWSHFSIAVVNSVLNSSILDVLNARKCVNRNHIGQFRHKHKLNNGHPNEFQNHFDMQ